MLADLISRSWASWRVVKGAELEEAGRKRLIMAYCNTITMISRLLTSSRNRWGRVASGKCDCGKKMHPDPFSSHRIGASLRDYAECGVLVSEHGETFSSV